MSTATIDVCEEEEPPPPPPMEPPPAAVSTGEINFEPRDKAHEERRRSSTGAHELAIPVLQSRLRAKLGANAKLPKKKPDLLALYIREIGD